MSPTKSNVTEERAFRNGLALQRTYTQKLNRENAVAQKEKVFKKQMFMSFVTGNKAQIKNQERDIESFYRQAKREEKKGKPMALLEQGFGISQKQKHLVDPKLKALLGQECHSNLKMPNFEERVERMFTKIQTNTARHKNDFENVEYELGLQVSRFMKDRNARLKDKELQY